MQILRQAIFDKINEKVIKFQVKRNKILYLTQSQLVISTVQLNPKKQFIPINGSNILQIQIHKDYVAILFKQPKLQIRRLQKLKQIICSYQCVSTSRPILKWWDDQLYLLYQNSYKKFNIYSTTIQSFQIHSNTTNQNVLNLQFSDLFPEVTNIIYHLKNKLIICLNDIKISEMQFQSNISQIIKLCHPFQTGQYNKQYLVTVQENHKIKIFNMITMKLIFQKKILAVKSQAIKVETDDLSQYLIIKSIDKKSQKIEEVTLLKINKQYYYSHQLCYDSEGESFFLFQIGLGLLQNFHLFPSHSQIIKGVLCDSIDMCYLKQKQIFIASVVISANYKNQIFYTKVKFQSPRNQLALWKDIVISKINPVELLNKITKIETKNQFQNYHLNLNIQQDLIIYAILKNLQKCNDFQKFDQNTFQTIKKALYVHYFPMLLDVQTIQKEQQSRTIKQMLQKSNEDCLNTMSGLSSSYECNNSDSQKHQPKQRSLDFINENVQGYNNNLSLYNQSIFEPDEHDKLSFCSECQKIEDEYHLNFIENTFKENIDLMFGKSLNSIQNNLFLMENNHKFRLGQIQKNLKTQAKQQKNINQQIQFIFQASLSKIAQNIQKSLHKFTLIVNQKSDLMKDYNQHKMQTNEKLKQIESNYNKNALNKNQLLELIQNISFQEDSKNQKQTYQDQDSYCQEDLQYFAKYLLKY